MQIIETLKKTITIEFSLDDLEEARSTTKEYIAKGYKLTKECTNSKKGIKPLMGASSNKYYIHLYTTSSISYIE